MATHFRGKVERLNPSEGRTFIRIQIPVAQQPLGNVFALRQSHQNYNALYSLALAAAINGYDLLIRTIGDVAPGQEAAVKYMLVDF
jgi:hypothetical protein